MARQYSISPSQPLTLAAPVATIETLGNDVHVDGPSISPTVITAGPHSMHGAAGLRLTTLSGTTRVVVTFIEELGEERLAEARREAEAEAAA